MSLENVTINFPCPECKLRFPVPLYQMNEGGIIVCPRCRANNAGIELRTIENHLEALGKSLQNLKTTLEGRINLKSRQQSFPSDST